MCILIVGYDLSNNCISDVTGSEDDDVDNELRMDAVTCYLELISKPSLPDILIKIICWVCVIRNHTLDCKIYYH